jgi:hypothetical protein
MAEVKGSCARVAQTPPAARAPLPTPNEPPAGLCSGSWCQVLSRHFRHPTMQVVSHQYTPTENRVAMARSMLSRIVTYSTLKSSCQSIASQASWNSSFSSGGKPARRISSWYLPREPRGDMAMLFSRNRWPNGVSAYARACFSHALPRAGLGVRASHLLHVP